MVTGFVLNGVGVVEVPAAVQQELWRVERRRFVMDPSRIYKGGRGNSKGDAGLPGFQVTRMPGYQVSRLPGCQVARFPGYQEPGLPGYQVTRNLGTQIPRC